MSFYKHWAYGLSFDSESHLPWLAIGVLDASTEAPRRAVANLLQDYEARLGVKN
jgi:hypothetical protein